MPLAVFAQANVQLPSTTVSATRFPEASRSLPFGVSVVTAQEIRRSGAATVNEALMRILGVPGRQDLWGGGEYTLDLRGFGATSDANQVVMLDGIRLSEADLGGTRLAGIPIEAVERIEVVRGNGAVLYGEGAAGGVIVITTRAGAGKSRPAGGSVYAGAGTYGLRDLRANAHAGAGGFSIDASAQKRKLDGHRDNFASDTRAGAVTAQWAGDRLRLGLRHAQDELDTRLPGALTTAQYEADPRQAATPNDFARIRNTATVAFGEAQWTSWELAFDAGTREKKLRSVNAFGPYEYDIASDNYAVRARHSTAIGTARNLLVAGYDHLRWTRDVMGAFGSTAAQESRAWYLKDDVTLAGGTRLALGVRTERARKTHSFAAPLHDRQTAWEAGVSHPFTPALTGYARVSRGFRFANVDEFSFTAPGSLLAPQTSRDAEAGLRWAHAAGQLEARVWRSDFDNEIGFDPNAAGTFGFGANVNFDPTRRQGLEVDATHRFTPAFGMRVNAQLREASFRSGPYAGRDVPLVPRRSVALRGDWTPAAGHTLSGGVQWVSSQHPDYANACTMPAYTTADLRYAYQWQQAELSLGVTNLAGRRYYSQAFACAAGRPTAIYPEPGRALTAALRVAF